MTDTEFNVQKIWHSERLVFRSLRQEDYNDFVYEMHSDPVIYSMATPNIMAPPIRQKPEEWFGEFTKRKPTLLHLAICLPAESTEQTSDNNNNVQEEKETSSKAVTKSSSEPKPIGQLHLAYGVYGPSPHTRAATLGIGFTAAYQNKGYGTEAVNWALDWAFRYANLHSVHLGSIEYNTRAHKCYEKCGFKLDGRQRQCFWLDRKYYDVFLYSIMEDEWEEIRKAEKK